MTGFRKATRQATFLKIGLSGISGSGKSYGALTLAKGLAGPNGRIAVADSENGSASLYAADDRGGVVSFDTLDIEAPYMTIKYVEAVNMAVEAGYEILVLD